MAERGNDTMKASEKTRRSKSIPTKASSPVDPVEIEWPALSAETIKALNQEIRECYRMLFKLLGGRKTLGIEGLQSERDLYQLIESGLPTEAIDSLLEAHRLARDEIHRFIVSERTLARRKERSGRLNDHESEVAVRVARVQALSEQVFGNKEKAEKWLRRKSRVLGERPLVMAANNAYGARLVEAELSHIAHGDVA